MERHSNSPPAVLLLACTGVTLVVFIAISVLQGLRPRSNDPFAPKTFPYKVPFLKSTIPFVFDGYNFFHRVLRYCDGEWPLRINILSDELYVVQSPRNISSVFSNPSLTVTRSYGIVLKYCFGMDQEAVNAYISDNSGSRARPIPGTNLRENQRVSYHTHENLVEGLLGAGLGPATQRIEDELFSSLDSVSRSRDWIYGEDLTEFIEDHLGSAMLKALFGPLLLADSPSFNRDLWNYDKRIMSLAKRLPVFCIPEAYRLRNKLLDSIMQWHRLATQLSAVLGKSDHENGDADLFWGSAMMRKRHEMLLRIKDQDLKSVASTDLAFIWATVTNVVPSTMTLCAHMYRDVSILEEIRASVHDTIKPDERLKFDLKRLDAKPLLLSMYAETLRFGVQIHIPRYTSSQGLNVGGKRVPRDKLVLVNTWAAHTDEKVWNSREGQFPLDTFWGRRFLVDPEDDRSGPVKRRADETSPSTTAITRQEGPCGSQSQAERDLRFSIQGLEGAWIPYGGGQHACPGRVLARRVMLLSAAMMATMFDIELLAPVSAFKFDSTRFGFGVRKPAGKLPFRIRRRP